MNVIEIAAEKNIGRNNDLKIKILVFTEGTIIGPRNLLQHFNHAAYVPIGAAYEKTLDWYKQGADIIYLTSRKNKIQVATIAAILESYNFAPGILISRDSNETYKDIVETVKPDVLIEDDCRSIGGKWQMCITYVRPEIKSKIKSIVVREFRGIDHLPKMAIDLQVT
ncbi:MAG TPA: hypothetical protein PLZ08_09665 [Bacillota bacterium]|jgi:hypothetical protein|nr:hypothetical protein [Bacillota bacterium]HOL09747.1 hypothetical protein [Bacillota bacterium]HPO98204.1 hypothetical protein [Bacillota bacterium]